MYKVLRYLSHPQVFVDRQCPVPQWHLSEIGRQRVLALGRSASLATTTHIFSSDETKAVETATIIGHAHSVDVTQIAEMGENDRSSTGFLEPEEFEHMADQFFAFPQHSIRGWERAVDAQSRIVSAAKQVLHAHDGDDILLVGHGAVGTLLYCHFAGLPITRQHDQTGGGGNFWSLNQQTMQPMHPWQPMELLADNDAH